MHKKEDVGYDAGGGSGVRKCGDCVYFVEPNDCRLVDGEINSDGICDLFDKDQYKVAQVIFKGFFDKLATPSRGRIVSDVSLIMDSDLHEDPALKPKRKRVVHSKGDLGGGRYLHKTFQHELSEKSY